MTRHFLVLTAAIGLAGAIAAAGTVIEAGDDEARNLKGRDKARDATPEEIAVYLAEMAEAAELDAQAAAEEADAEALAALEAEEAAKKAAATKAKAPTKEPTE